MAELGPFNIICHDGIQSNGMLRTILSCTESGDKVDLWTQGDPLDSRLHGPVLVRPNLVHEWLPAC